MIFLRLKGGLGNQVFQMIYANLKTSKNERVFVDYSNFGRVFDKDYAAGDFLVNKIISSDFTKKFVYINVGYKLSSVIWKLVKYFNSYFLDDYFSDVRNFPIDHNYRQYFNLEVNNQTYVFDENSVLIHVRKGDYTNAVNSKVYFNCDQNYFSKAVEQISIKVSRPKFYIMSNDNNWVKENFIFLKEYTVLDIKDPVLSFKVMCKFSNFIISNSTFSWWPAFITQSKNVIVPKKWYLEMAKNNNLYPDHWIKV